MRHGKRFNKYSVFIEGVLLETIIISTYDIQFNYALSSFAIQEWANFFVLCLLLIGLVIITVKSADPTFYAVNNYYNAMYRYHRCIMMSYSTTRFDELLHATRCCETLFHTDELLPGVYTGSFLFDSNDWVISTILFDIVL